MVREIPDLKLNAKLARNTKFEGNENKFLAHFFSVISAANKYCSSAGHHAVLQINIVPVLVTMNRKIEKPPVKLNFRWFK